jgi:hypothetical protein
MVVRLKDTIVIHTVENNEKMALAKGNPVAIGDQVLVSKLPDGTFVTHGNDTINVGDTVLVNTMSNGEYVTVKGGNCFLISRGYNRPLPYGYPIPPNTPFVIDFLGNFKYKWNGEGKVYVSSSCCVNLETDTITLDDELIIINANNEFVTCAYNAIPRYAGYARPGPPLEITSLLTKGMNELRFYIQDLFGAGMGCGPLYISQTYLNVDGSQLLITRGYDRPINTRGVETDTIATVNYNWDGIGKIYISSSYCADPLVDKILIDDQLIVTNSNGQSVSVSNPAGLDVEGAPDLEITSLLIKGDNTLTFEIHDIIGVSIGCAPLFLIQY